MNSIKKHSRVTKGKLERRAGDLEEMDPRQVNCRSMTLPLRDSDHSKVHHGSNSKIWTCRSRESETPQRVVRWVPNGVQGDAYVYR